MVEMVEVKMAEFEASVVMVAASAVAAAVEVPAWVVADVMGDTAACLEVETVIVSAAVERPVVQLAKTKVGLEMALVVAVTAVQPAVVLTWMMTLLNGCERHHRVETSFGSGRTLARHQT